MGSANKKARTENKLFKLQIKLVELQIRQLIQNKIEQKAQKLKEITLK
jgi:hypothetical protein